MEDFTLAEYIEELCEMGDEVNGNEKLTQFLFKTAYLVKGLRVLGLADDVEIKFNSENN